LLRELILRACMLPVLYDEAGAERSRDRPAARRDAALPSVALDLKMPADPRVERVADAATTRRCRTLDDWARGAGASGRTLARLFLKETGLSFADWRQQARLLAAMARLAAGQPITRIALDLGYDSPSAFTAMFRRALGAPPSQYLSRP
jgi:AraC-like DNA-binding protein